MTLWCARSPAFYRFDVGDIEATVVSDGLIVAVPKTTFVGPAAINVEKMMTNLFLPPDKLVMDQNALVINTSDKLALFETGMASVKRTEDMGLLVGNLEAAGIDPKDIDYLIPSHAHIDHIGGILAADGSRNFPNAQIFISQADLEPATGVSRREFRALTEVPTFPEVGGQESGLWGGNSGVSRRRRRNSERVSAR
jgi:glyoxylase-like metal-dependent hydrolase (beta-lactamase superfamily II)